MKKRKLILLAAGGVLSASLVVAAIALPAQSGGITTIKANASVRKSEISYNDFSGENASEDYAFTNTEIFKEYDALHFSACNLYGAAVALAAQPLGGYAKYVFEIKPISASADSQIWFSFGGENVYAAQYKYEQCLWIQDSNTTLCANDGEKFVPSEKNVKYYPFEKTLFTSGSDEITIELTAKRDKAGKYTITAEYFSGGSAFDVKYAFENVVLEEGGCVALRGVNFAFDMLNFAVKNEAGEIMFSDDFSENSLAYFGESGSEKEWRANSAELSEKHVRAGGTGKLKLSGDSSATNLHVIENNGKTTDKAEISFLLTKSEWKGAARFAIDFGSAEKTPAEKIQLVAERAEDAAGAEAEYSFSYFENGEKKRSFGKAYFTESEFSQGVPVKILCGGDYSLTAEVFGRSLTVKNVDYDGCFSLVTQANGGEIAVFVDEIALNTYEEISYVQSDVSNDFCGVKTDETGVVLPYINRQKYFLGNGVTLENGYLSFYESNAYSNFGVIGKYSEFAVAFDAEVNSTGVNGQKFGLSFAKSSPAIYYENCNSIAFFYNGFGESAKSGVKGYGCRLENGETQINELEDHFFPTVKTENGQTKKSIQKYNFLFVAQNNAVEVYYKKAEEPQEKLSVLRAKFTGVNTDGYVTLFGSDGVGFDVTNFRMIDLSVMAKTKNGIDDLRNYTSSASQNFGAEGLSFGVSGNSRMAIGLSKAQGAIEFALENAAGEKVALTLKNDGKTVEFTLGGRTETASLPQRINLKNGYTNFELRISNGKISLGAAKESRPAEEIYSNRASFSLASFVPVAAVIVCEEGAEATFLNVYDFTKKYTAARADFETDPDNGNPWLVKDMVIEVAPRKSHTLIIALAIAGGVLLVGGGIAVAIVAIGRKKR